MGGLGGKRGGPEFLLLGGRELGTGGGGFLGGEVLGTANKKHKNTFGGFVLASVTCAVLAEV